MRAGKFWCGLNLTSDWRVILQCTWWCQLSVKCCIFICTKWSFSIYCTKSHSLSCYWQRTNWRCPTARTTYTPVRTCKWAKEARSCHRHVTNSTLEGNHESNRTDIYIYWYYMCVYINIQTVGQWLCIFKPVLESLKSHMHRLMRFFIP